MKLLIVEDEAKTASFLKRGFGEAGFLVHVASDGFEAKHQIETGSFELIVLDILLPGMDGWEILTWSRSSGIQTPILLLTARDSVADRVRGLELGADDYLVKPFAFSELLARVRTTGAGGSQDSGGRSGARFGRPSGHTGWPVARSDGAGIHAAFLARATSRRSADADFDRRIGMGHEFRGRYERGRCESATASHQAG